MENKDYRILETPLYPAVEINIENTLDKRLEERFDGFESSNDIGDLSWKNPT